MDGGIGRIDQEERERVPGERVPWGERDLSRSIEVERECTGNFDFVVANLSTDANTAHTCL